MTTSLVTGGAGFLGSHLVDALTKRGESVVAVDDLSTGRLGNLERAIASGRVTFVYVDVAIDAAALRATLADTGIRKLDAIYHLAAPGGLDADGEHHWDTLAVNGLGTLSLIEIALEQQARFVFSSSTDPARTPAGSDEGKLCGEAAVAAAIRGRGLDGRIARLINCYGPRMQQIDGSWIVSLLEATAAGQALPIYGSGEQTRSLTYVDDAVGALLLAMSSKQSPLQPIVIEGHDERSVLDIAELLARVAQIEFRPELRAGRPGDSQRCQADPALTRVLGRKTSLEDGLRKTYDWFARESRLFV